MTTEALSELFSEFPVISMGHPESPQMNTGLAGRYQPCDSIQSRAANVTTCKCEMTLSKVHKKKKRQKSKVKKKNRQRRFTAEKNERMFKSMDYR